MVSKAEMIYDSCTIGLPVGFVTWAEIRALDNLTFHVVLLEINKYRKRFDNWPPEELWGAILENVKKA